MKFPWCVCPGDLSLLHPHTALCMAEVIWNGSGMGIVVVQQMGLFGIPSFPPGKVRKGLWVELESAGLVSSVELALYLHPAWQENAELG